MAGETNDSTTNDTPVSPAAEALVFFPKGEEIVLEFPSGLPEQLEIEEVFDEPKATEPAAPEVHQDAPEEPKQEEALPPEPIELFGKDAIRALLQEAGARYPLQRDRLLEWARPKSVLFWRDYPRVPLGELLGLSRSSIFHSEDEVLAHVDSYLRVKPGGPIFSTNYGR